MLKRKCEEFKTGRWRRGKRQQELVSLGLWQWTKIIFKNHVGFIIGFSWGPRHISSKCVPMDASSIFGWWRGREQITDGYEKSSLNWVSHSSHLKKGKWMAMWMSDENTSQKNIFFTKNRYFSHMRHSGYCFLSLHSSEFLNIHSSSLPQIYSPSVFYLENTKPQFLMQSK